MDFHLWFDWTVRGLAALSGLCLIGLMVIRPTPSGRWKILSLRHFGPMVEPKWRPLARIVFWVFAYFVLLVVIRSIRSV